PIPELPIVRMIKALLKFQGSPNNT
ncbi:hypothetical protein PanWU01x14_070170, partial [Parasponia andersonii]